MTVLTATEASLVDAWLEKTGRFENVSKKELAKFAETIGIDSPIAHIVLNQKATRTSRGKYSLRYIAPDNRAGVSGKQSDSNIANVVPMTAKSQSVAVKNDTSDDDVHIPSKIAEFVNWGYFGDVKTIIASRMFYPVFISGMSGNGKTMMVEQVCAHLSRSYVRVQITPETDEDDLIGGFRLVDGSTVYEYGPVVKAMLSGSVLLIDEIDRGSNKLMALQGILEGKPILIKKTGELIHAAEGFNIIATANTKGRGDSDGRYSSATILDDAFLERFTITIEQPYPDAKIEHKIVENHLEKFGVTDSEFANKLIQWSNGIRQTFEAGGIDDLISTRRLCHIAQTYSIFRNRRKAVELCINRFDEETREAFLSLYRKIDVTKEPEPTAKTEESSFDPKKDPIPF